MVNATERERSIILEWVDKINMLINNLFYLLNRLHSSKIGGVLGWIEIGKSLENGSSNESWKVDRLLTSAPKLKLTGRCFTAGGTGTKPRVGRV